MDGLLRVCVLGNELVSFVEPGVYSITDNVRLYIYITRYSLLPAITTNGFIYSHIKVGSYNGDEFLEWLRGLLVVMNPYPAPQSVLVLDNCRIHHVPGVREMCDAR